MSERMIAVCGIDCSGCPLLKASLGDLKAAEHLAEWWHAAGWLDADKGPADVVAGGPHCLGCRGDRAKHWSANCWILKCCVDERELDSCHECKDFACDRLVHHTYNLQLWLECREAAVAFMQQAKVRLPGHCDALFDEAGARYTAVCERLRAALAMHPPRENPDWGPQSTFGSPEAADVIRQAAEADAAGLAQLRRILASL